MYFGTGASVPAKLIDHYAIDPAGLDVGDKSSKRGAFHFATRESTIVITIR
jgi:hypothetical protein